jgi:hypothetical protein
MCVMWWYVLIVSVHNMMSYETLKTDRRNCTKAPQPQLVGAHTCWVHFQSAAGLFVAVECFVMLRGRVAGWLWLGGVGVSVVS